MIKSKTMRAFIFDMDGVIFDTELLWKLAFEKANKRFNVTLNEEYRISICGKNEMVIRNELKSILPSLDVEAYRNYTIQSVNNDISDGKYSIKKGFFSLINNIKMYGMKVAFATSSHEARAVKLFERKGVSISDFFDVTVFGDEVGSKSKPDPYIFQLAAQKLNLAPQECCVVEDSINGVKAAISGGFRCIMVEDLIPPDNFCFSNADKIVKELYEIDIN